MIHPITPAPWGLLDALANRPVKPRSDAARSPIVATAAGPVSSCYGPSSYQGAVAEIDEAPLNARDHHGEHASAAEVGSDRPPIAQRRSGNGVYLSGR